MNYFFGFLVTFYLIVIGYGDLFDDFVWCFGALKELAIYSRDGCFCSKVLLHTFSKEIDGGLA